MLNHPYSKASNKGDSDAQTIERQQGQAMPLKVPSYTAEMQVVGKTHGKS